MAEEESSTTRLKLSEAQATDAALNGDPTIEQVPLPRGGTYIETSVGPIQFGIPPETIKDTMAMGIPTPRHFYVPSERFCRSMGPSMGVNLCEFEFTAYLNFFFKKQSVNLIVGSQEVEEAIRKVFQETLFGPEEIDIDADFHPSYPVEDRPDLLKELGFFRKFGDTLMTIEMLLGFTHFNNEGIATITDNDGHEVQLIRDDEFVVVMDNGNFGCRIADRVDLPVSLPIEPSDTHFTFIPPRFGVTVLGSSHGFDPAGRTSGYLLWCNGHGVLIDPPPQVMGMLESYHIPPSLIDGVIISHCHADHDAGTFQKILLENKVTLMTTRTIYGSFIRKYSALAGLDTHMLERAFRFRPVRIGEDVSHLGAKFRFFYTLHSIPCVGFEVFFGGKSMIFSADHMNDPAKINALHDEEHVISAGRRDRLLSFPWHHDCILHEAGVPPIHTPMSTLEALPDDVKERLYVVHVAAKSIPEGQGLKVAPVGVENTIVLDVEARPYDDAAVALDHLHVTTLFSHVDISTARELIQVATKEVLPAGTQLATAGQPIDKLYVVSSGRATCSEEDKFFSRGSTVGELCILDMALPHPQTVTVDSELTVLSFPADHVHWLLRDTHVQELVKTLQDTGEDSVWETIRRNSVLSLLTGSQQLSLESNLRRRTFVAGEIIWRQNEPANVAVLLHAGHLQFDVNDGPERINTPRGSTVGINQVFSRGALVAEVEQIMKDLPATTTLVAQTDGVLYDIAYSELKAFVVQNPALLMAIGNSHFVV